jgi:hypothetical protein
VVSYICLIARMAPNPKSPAASGSKVEGSGMALACTIVFGKLNPTEFTTTPNSCKSNGPVATSAQRSVPCTYG